ncbi:hypothetical protein CLOP_g8650 [Closterium sp. NIES-67]|nr:hypothetical protein CLOP_g22300 [Closterium sp. NIES-67]GJP78330.1 hypothetical protein CLOP_g8650 [Closterium sp. NIES-67]
MTSDLPTIHLLTDDLLLRIFRALASHGDYFSHGLVCRRWYCLARSAQSRVRVKSNSGIPSRLILHALSRFPSLSELDLLAGSVYPADDRLIHSLATSALSQRLCRLHLVFEGRSCTNPESPHSATPASARSTEAAFHRLFSSCTRLTHLTLKSKSSSVTLPPSIATLTSLTHLHLDFDFSSLPSSLFASLTLLQSLELRSRNLQSLPDTLGQLKKLCELTVQCTALEALPESIGDYFFLSRLELLECCRLQELPDPLCTLPNLSHLNIQNCDSLICLPEDFGQLQSLRCLKLSCYSADFTLPESFFYLSNLQTLEISFSWCHWPSACLISFRCLASLARLSLQGMFVHSLPPALLQPPSLRILTLSSLHLLTAFPHSPGQLENLRELTISDCEKLETLPSSFFSSSPNLSSLTLSALPLLASLPEFLGAQSNLHQIRLHQLHLDYCSSLSDLPASLSSLSSLRHLSIRHCPSLSALPHGIALLPSLQSLVLVSLPGVTSLESVFLGRGVLVPAAPAGRPSGGRGWGRDCEGQQQQQQQQQQQEQDQEQQECRHSLARGMTDDSLNGIQHFPSLESLRIISLPSISSLPEPFGQLPKLRKLVLQACGNLSKLPHSFLGLGSLHYLHISNLGNLSTLPEDIGQLPTLETLLLEDLPALAHLPASLSLPPLTSTLQSLHLPLLLTPSPAEADTASCFDVVRGVVPGLESLVLHGSYRCTVTSPTGTSSSTKVTGVGGTSSLVLSGAHDPSDDPSDDPSGDPSGDASDGAAGGDVGVDWPLLSAQHAPSMVAAVSSGEQGWAQQVEQLALQVGQLSHHALRGLASSLPRSISHAVPGYVADHTGRERARAANDDNSPWNVIAAGTSSHRKAVLAPCIPDDLFLSPLAPSHLRLLHLHSCHHLLHLPSSLPSIPHLCLLSLSNLPCLASLPPSLHLLSSLTCLQLTDCTALTHLPASLFCLPELERLALIRCYSLVALPTVPTSTDSCPHAKATDALLSEGSGNVNPSTSVVFKLRVLHMEECYMLAELPSSVTMLQGLERVTVDGCFRIHRLPEGMVQLPYLRSLAWNGRDVLQGR